MSKKLISIVAALALLFVACSEAAPDEAGGIDAAGGADTAPTAAADVEEPDAASTPATETAGADESDAEPAAAEPADAEPTTDSAEPADDPRDEPEGNEPADDPADEGDPGAGSVIEPLAGSPWFRGEIPASPVAADPSLEPVRIGMINQEDTPLGSFPEVRAAAEAAVAFINAELGGVGGRPIELDACITSFNPEQSAACAQELVQNDVIALVGGVDLSSNGAFPIIEQNGLAVIGGIPAGLVEQRSPNSFSFSGGGAGAAAAFMQHAADSGASTVLLAYGEFEAFEVAARDYAAVVGESLGLNVELLSFSLFATDYLPVLTKARDVEADAIIVLAADSACVPVMQNAADLGLDAQLYLTGGCASDSIIEAAGESIIGVLFNAEGPVAEGDPEGEIFGSATERYSTAEAGGAGTVGFRAMMNLYGLLADLGPDALTADAVLAAARATVDEPSFWGHPYTCDGNQVPGLPALCAPQQVLFEVTEAGGTPSGVGDWIDTAALFQVIDG